MFELYWQICHSVKCHCINISKCNIRIINRDIQVNIILVSYAAFSEPLHWPNGFLNRIHQPTLHKSTFHVAVFTRIVEVYLLVEYDY